MIEPHLAGCCASFASDVLVQHLGSCLHDRRDIPSLPLLCKSMRLGRDATFAHAYVAQRSPLVTRACALASPRLNSCNYVRACELDRVVMDNRDYQCGCNPVALVLVFPYLRCLFYWCLLPLA